MKRPQKDHFRNKILKTCVAQRQNTFGEPSPNRNDRVPEKSTQYSLFITCHSLLAAVSLYPKDLS